MQLHHTHMTNDALVRYMDAAAEVYAKYNVNGALQDPVQNGQRWSLEAAMGCYESLYILEASEMEPVPLVQVQLSSVFQNSLLCARGAP